MYSVFCVCCDAADGSGGGKRNERNIVCRENDRENETWARWKVKDGSNAFGFENGNVNLEAEKKNIWEL